MMLDSITPLILTLNEAPNIGNTLAKLRWAKEIVIVDSFSSDETLELAKKVPQVRIFQRTFDSHAQQWNFGLQETSICTDWVLALDADYLLTDELIDELKGLEPPDNVHGYRVGFRYCIEGKPLRGTVYPPVAVLYRRNKASYKQDGHTQRVYIEGAVGGLKALIHHDDRKPLSHWLRSQARYMKLESEKLLSFPFSQLSWADRLRRLYVFAPFVMFFYCLIIKGALLDGRAGLYYALQRMTAEMILSLHLMAAKLSRMDK